MRQSLRMHRWATAMLIGSLQASTGWGQQKISVDPPPAEIRQPAMIGMSLAGGESPIDLGTALRLAGAQNPELLLARERLTEAMANRQLAAAQALPNINAGTNYNLHRGPLQQANGNILKLNREAMYVGLGASAVGAGTVNIPGINYNLNVGTAWYGYLQSKQTVARVSDASRTAENNILLRVCLAYTDLLRAEARRSIASQNRTEAADLARLTDAYAKAGQGRKADADRANVELRKREAELTQSEADTLTASARLSQLLSLDPATRLKPIDGWVVPAPIVPDPVPLSELIAIALMQRPELAERRAEIQEALYALASAKILPYSPNVILGLSTGTFGGGSNLVSSSAGIVTAGRNRQTSPRFGNFDGRTDLDLVMFWTLQNLGVGNLALTKAADSRAKQANWRERETFNRVRTEVAETHARVNARFLQIDSTAKAFEASQEAFKQDFARIKGREGLPIEVIDSLRLLSRSRYEYLDAVIDYNRSQFQLYVAIGQPPAAALSRPVPAGIVPEKK